MKEAIKTDTIKVVNFDWLEDSLRLKRCLKEQKYLMEALHTKKSRQPKGGLGGNSKVTKSGRPSKGELASLFISHLDEYQGSRTAGRGGPGHSRATKRASDSAAVKRKGKAKGKGKEKNQEGLVVTTVCPNTAADLLEAHVRAKNEKLSAPEQNDDMQPFSAPTLPAEDEAATSAAAPPAYIPEANAESVDEPPMIIDSEDLLVSDHSFTGPEPANLVASQPQRSVAPSKTNTLPSRKNPPPGNPSYDYWRPAEISKYHIYKDGSGFEYNVTLVRIDIRRNSNERFVLRLYESHTSDLLPATGDEAGIVAGAEAEDGHGANTYVVWQRFVSEKNGGEPVVQCLAAEGTEFEMAMGVFKYAFRTWTRRRWEERDKKVKSGGSDGEGSGLDSQVNWEDGVTMAEGLPSREEAKSKPFAYVKPGVCPRSKRAYGLGGMSIVSRYAARA